MKLNRLITLCAMTAALALSATDLFAQQDNGNNNNNGQNGGRRNRQNGGQNGQGGQGGNFDPAAMQQRIMDNYRDRLNFTNDTEWSAVEPLVSKVVTAQMDARGAQMRGAFGRNRGGQGGPGGPGGGPANPEGEALQKAIDDNAPAAQIKDLLAKYRAAHKSKLAKLETAQADLKKVLTSKQEAQAALLGLVN